MSSTNTIQATRETERKYEVAEQVRLPNPKQLLGRGTDATPEIQQLDAVYFDTAGASSLRSKTCP